MKYQISVVSSMSGESVFIIFTHNDLMRSSRVNASAISSGLERRLASDITKCVITFVYLLLSFMNFMHEFNSGRLREAQETPGS